MTFVIQQSYKATFGFKIDSVWHGIGLMVGCSWCVLECKFARSGFKKGVSVVGYCASRIEGQPVPMPTGPNAISECEVARPSLPCHLSPR